MTATSLRAAALAGASLLVLSQAVVAQSPEGDLPDIVVIANRNPQAIARTGSAVTVIRAEEIASNPSNRIVDVLRSVPGLDTYESGGAGGVSPVSIRGATPGQTLILVDGVRVNDPTAPSGEFDFGVMSVTDLDRIEILRGPQSALYGSDAMGGVVNIVTRKGAKDPKVSVSVEGGSYGTLNTRAAVSGGTDTISYAFSLSGFRTDGFSRYGYRIGRIAAERALAGLPTKLENDPAEKLGSTGRVSWRPVGDFELELGYAAYGSFVRFDNPGAYFTDSDDRLNKSRNRFEQVHAKATLESFGGSLRSSLLAYANRSTHYTVLTQGCYDSFYNSYDCRNTYTGERFGLEYQGDLKLGRLGLLSFGLRGERETANSTEQYLPLPTLFQRYSVYGLPTLLPEKNVGFDAGVDQTLANGRAKLSLTAFRTLYSDLIDYNTTTSKYYNIGHALMQGVEVSGDVTLVPETWRLRASYTYLHARNTDKDVWLPRRPFNKGYVSLVWTGWKNLELEGRLSMVGERFDVDNVTGDRLVMPAYARFDLRADYKVTTNVALFGRIENVTNAKYEEVRDYGTSGRAFYAGVRATW